MRNPRRQAFTLVELMVAMALIIFIMAILSEAFVVGMKTFRDLKAVGDMDQHLRTITSTLRDDLRNDHFTGRIRLSDPGFWSQGTPREGFFSAVQMTPLQNTIPVGGITAPGYYDEGPDADGNHSFVATDHRLHFMVKRRGNQKDRFFSATVPAGSPLIPLLPPYPPGTANPNYVITNFDQELGAFDGRLQDAAGSTYSSQWAEVGYFLLPTIDGTLGTTGTGPIGVPLYGLYRCELPVLPDNSNINFPAPGKTVPIAAGDTNTWSNMPQYLGLSCNPAQDPNNQNNYFISFNNPSDLTTATRRAFDPTNPAIRPNTNPPPGSTRPVLQQQATLLMTDVISFHIQLLFAWDKAIPQGTGEVLTQENQVYGTFVDFNGFDSGVPLPVSGPPINDPNRPPDTNPPRVVAIKIAIRVWDAKTQQARQITVVQDM
ncbi:MAG: PilW family protein [Gemmataceae bacterium]